MAVIDASVYVAIMNPNEVGHDSSMAWFKQEHLAQRHISTPVIFLAEVASAMSRGLEDGELARRVIQQIKRHRLINLKPVTANLAERAAYIAAEHKIRGCDAIYVALAEQLGEELITLDNQQLQRGTAVIATRQP